MKQTSYISFDNTSREFVLETLGKKLDNEGYIIDAKTELRVLTQEGDPVHVNEFGGVKKGSEIFFKKDLPSMLNALSEVSTSVAE